MIEASVIIPCRNEERFIDRCCGSIIVQDYPKDKLEVLFVDGMSVDRTREIIRKYSERYPYIRLLENRKKITPSALNIGIRNAKGSIVIRMDAHSEYPAHYIRKGIEYLKTTGADVVGGPVDTIPGDNTLMAKGIALATSHPFGVGNSKFRTSKYEGYVDTVPFGVYRRQTFQKTGLFDERLVRNEDNELNSRIITAGGKIFSTPELTAVYYNQSTLRGLLSQAVRTGTANARAVIANPGAFRIRRFIPFFFVMSILVLMMVSLIYPQALLLLAGLVLLYVTAAALSTFAVLLREKTPTVLLLLLIFPVYHLVYGFGTISGFLEVLFRKRTAIAS